MALQQWRHYVASSPTLCITDHVALRSLVGAKEHSSSRQAQYALDLQEYKLEIIHRAGARHYIADIISRAPAVTVATTPGSLAPKEVPEDTKHYYGMVREVGSIGVVPTNPESFEQMLNQKMNPVGTKACKYQDPKMFGETIGHQSLANALNNPSIRTELAASIEGGYANLRVRTLRIRQGPSGPAFRTRAAGAFGTTGHSRS